LKPILEPVQFSLWIQKWINNPEKLKLQ
jgi:hypothetical protein